jgi:hypothetical protein
MKQRLCEVNAAAVAKLPRHTDDKSGIGVHYVDAYLKPMNAKLEDGTPVKCKRRGLKIALAVGTRKGGAHAAARGELRPDRHARRRASGSGEGRGVELSVEDGALYLTY